MAKNEAVEIVPVANGWIVRTPINHMSGASYPVSESKVFQTMRELNQFINRHFDYRSGECLLDD